MIGPSWWLFVSNGWVAMVTLEFGGLETHGGCGSIFFSSEGGGLSNRVVGLNMVQVVVIFFAKFQLRLCSLLLF